MRAIVYMTNSTVSPRRMARSFWLAALVAAIPLGAGCADGPGPDDDAGHVDADLTDASVGDADMGEDGGEDAGPDATLDAGEFDGGEGDAAALDATTMPMDEGVVPMDNGLPDPDTGLPDLGPFDAGYDAGVDSGPPPCAEDDTQTRVCGVLGNGTLPQRCVGGAWVDDGVCDDPDVDEVTASDDGVRALEAVDPLVTGAGGSFPVAGLLANDSFAAAATFALQGGGTTSCNGQVGLQAGNVVYTGPANLAPVSTCRTSDSFTYQVCAAAPAVGCDTATVTITINRRPSVASTLSCAPVNTANLSLGVQSVFSDPDGDGLDASSIVATGPGGSISRSGDVITWSPNNASNAGTYAQSLTACDDNALPGCAQGVWSVVWNDPPVLTSFPTPFDVTTLQAAQAIQVDSEIFVSTGAAMGAPLAEAIASVTVGATMSGAFAGSSVVTPLGGTCALVGGQLLYTAGGTMGADSCWVRICETCGASPVCSVTEVRYQVRCAEDDTRTSVCGVMGNGTQPQRCVGGEWVDDGVCDDPDVDEVTASDDGVRALEAVDPLVTGAGGSFPVAGLLANDSFAAAATFALQGGGTTSCNGQVGLQAGNVVYTGPANLAPVSTCRTSDSFTYQVCAAAPAVGCDTATVTITINRRPSVASTLSCAPVNTANLSLGVQSVFSDPDGDGLDASSIVATGPGGSISRSGDVITWSPNNASNAGTYAQSLTACDDNALPGCAQGVWSVVWNDPPVLTSFPTPFDVTVLQLAPALAVDSEIFVSTGAAMGAAPAQAIASVAVGATMSGAFSESSVVTSLGGTCALAGGQLLYSAGANLGTDSCWVRICETCGASPVCSVTQVRYQVLSP